MPGDLFSGMSNEQAGLELVKILHELLDKAEIELKTRVTYPQIRVLAQSKYLALVASDKKTYNEAIAETIEYILTLYPSLDGTRAKEIVAAVKGLDSYFRKQIESVQGGPLQ